MLEVTTESGRKYHIDLEDSMWRRLPKSDREYMQGWESIWALMRGTEFREPRPDDPAWTSGMPVVGEYMFISARDFWWTTTKIVSIEEKENEDD